MPTAAIAAYGVELRMGNGIPLAQLGIASTTNTTPIILTTVPHGLTVGDVSWADVFGVTGNLGANGSWVVQAQTATTLVLRGSVGTGVSSGTGGLIFRNTFLTVAELVNITPIGIAFNMVDASAHDGKGGGPRSRRLSVASICGSRSTSCRTISRTASRMACLAWPSPRFGATGW